MSSLLLQINEQANTTIIETEIARNNVILLAEYLSMSTDQLTEAVSSWLAKVRNLAAKGSLDPNKKDSVVKILGALEAISNEDLADALDDRGDLGTILYNAGSEDKAKSNAGLQRLLLIGREPSVKTFVSKAAAMIEDPQKIDNYTKKIQADIERVMNKKLGMERRNN